MEGVEHTSALEPIQRKWRPTVEPLVFIVSLATAITGVTTQSFFMQRICEFQFYNGTLDLNLFCKNLTQHKDQEAEVETIAGMYNTYRMFLMAAPQLLLALVWGQLNDRFGSKRMLYIPMVGYVVTNIIFYVLTYFQASHPVFLLLAILPDAFTGGSVALTISIFKLIVHTSTQEERTFRIGIAEGAMLVGNPIGLLIGAKILDASGFGAVFLLSGVLHLLAIISAIIFVIDDGPAPANLLNTQSESKCWSLEKLKESAKVFGPHKMLLFLIIFIPSVRSFVMGGNGTVMYMFTRFKFEWDQTAFSAFSTFGGVLSALGLLAVSTVALKLLRIPDALLGAISAVSFAIGCSVWAFASVPWLMYLGSAIQLCQGISIIIVRSMISTIVKSEDVGKAMSVLSIPENLMPFISTPLYNAIYLGTLYSFIGTAFLVSAILNAIVVVAFGYIYFIIPPSSVQPLYNEESEYEHVPEDEMLRTQNSNIQET